jgi:hypothetical protein
MLLVPNLEVFKGAWLQLKKEGFALHGFFLFVGSDHYFPEYVTNSGLADLELWTGRTCGLFVLHPPSTAWVDYTRRQGHIWWKLFGRRSEVTKTVSEQEGGEKILALRAPSRRSKGTAPAKLEKLPPELEQIKDQLLLEIDGKLYSPADLFSPSHDQFHHSMEIEKVLRRFDLPPTSHPCFIFFRDLNDAYGWFVELKDLVNLPEPRLRSALKDWLSGPEFRKLLEEAKRA